MIVVPKKRSLLKVYNENLRLDAWHKTEPATRLVIAGECKSDAENCSQGIERIAVKPKIEPDSRFQQPPVWNRSADSEDQAITGVQRARQSFAFEEFGDPFGKSLTH